jgi:hypothetical protein
MDKLEEIVATDASDAMLILEKFLEICSVVSTCTHPKLKIENIFIAVLYLFL